MRSQSILPGGVPTDDDVRPACDNLALDSCILRCSMRIYRETDMCIAQAPGSPPVSGVTGRLDLTPRAGSRSSTSFSVACPAPRASTLRNVRVVQTFVCRLQPCDALFLIIFAIVGAKEYAPQLYLKNLFL